MDIITIAAMAANVMRAVIAIATADAMASAATIATEDDTAGMIATVDTAMGVDIAAVARVSLAGISTAVSTLAKNALPRSKSTFEICRPRSRR
jgi:hypothetical protein